MDPFGIFDLITGFLTPGGGDPHLLRRAEERYPDVPKMLAREPRIDAGRPIALIATADDLVVLGDDDASSAPWDRVLGISRRDETVTITIASENGTDERDFVFERLEESGFLAWGNLPAAHFVVEVNRIRRGTRG